MPSHYHHTHPIDSSTRRKGWQRPRRSETFAKIWKTLSSPILRGIFRIRRHPDAFKRIRTGLNKSKKFENLERWTGIQKKSRNFKNLAKNLTMACLDSFCIRLSVFGGNRWQWLVFQWAFSHPQFSSSADRDLASAYSSHPNKSMFHNKRSCGFNWMSSHSQS